MNREIRFRAWDRSTEQMYMDILIGDSGRYVACEYETDDSGFVETSYSTSTNGKYPDSFKIMQYTGLKDKNGKEIYEGDIISYWNGTINEDNNGTIEYENKKYSRTKNTIVEIVYEAPSFRIKNGNPLLSNCLEQKDIEIIGNIYENPELLEPKIGEKSKDEE